jgi:hypothetical protein
MENRACYGLKKQLSLRYLRRQTTFILYKTLKWKLAPHKERWIYAYAQNFWNKDIKKNLWPN